MSQEDELTIQSALKMAAKLIDEHPTLTYQSGKLEAQLLMSEVLQKNSAYLIAYADKILSANEQQYFNKLLAQRLAEQPIAYILGQQSFWNLDLKVSPYTLIPRQDTEILVETAISLALPKSARVIDLGTGTGAIALAIAKEMPYWQVFGIDKIPQAVSLAKENALKNNIAVSFYESDWFEIFDYHKNLSGKFDLIVSNPPYVEPDSKYIEQGDLRFEPLSALVAKNNGLADLQHIIEQASKRVSDNGFLLLEHGMEQAPAVSLLLQKAGFSSIRHIQDLNGLDRATLGQWQV